MDDILEGNLLEDGYKGSSSCLQKLLHMEILPDKGRTPHIIEHQVPQDGALQTFLTSTSRGLLISVRNGHDGGVGRSAFFKLPFEEESSFFTQVVKFWVHTSEDKGWSNFLKSSSLGKGFQESLEAFFTFSEEIQLAQVFVGERGFQALQRAGLLTDEAGNPMAYEEVPKPSVLGHVGFMDRKFVFLEPSLGSYMVFASKPEYIGLYTRMGDWFSLFIHNPEYGAFLVEIEE